MLLTTLGTWSTNERNFGILQSLWRNAILELLVVTFAAGNSLNLPPDLPWCSTEETGWTFSDRGSFDSSRTVRFLFGGDSSWSSSWRFRFCDPSPFDSSFLVRLLLVGGSSSPTVCFFARSNIRVSGMGIKTKLLTTAIAFFRVGFPDVSPKSVASSSLSSTLEVPFFLFLPFFSFSCQKYHYNTFSKFKYIPHYQLVQPWTSTCQTSQLGLGCSS